MFQILRRLRRVASKYAVYIAIVSTGLAVQAAAVSSELFERFYHFSRAHEAWELDELFTLFITATITFAALLFTHDRKLRREVKARQMAEDRATMLARHDPLTGLANRRRFHDELDRRALAVRSSGGGLAALVIDLDRFKPVNDAYGHAAGDELLQEVAKRIERSCPAGALIARLGGDEFAVVLEFKKDADTSGDIAARIVKQLARGFRLTGPEIDVDVSASVGVALLEGGIDGHELMQRADHAMYKAKREGRNALAHFDADLDRKIRERASLETEMRRAIRSGEFEPFFQPLVDFRTGRICSFEVLARWRHPTRGLVGPNEFIPIAEETGLIGDLSWSVLRQACLAARDWSDETLSLAFNLAPCQFQDRMLAHKVCSVLEETGFPGERLEIEITENAVIVDHEAARAIIDRLKASGVRVALDDFGTGYSSVTSLHKLPFDKVKIDRSFVTNASGDPRTATIVQAILSLTHSLGLIATAEGVETVEDVAWLQGLGCDQAQGFYFGRPMPAGEVAWALDAEAEKISAETATEPAERSGDAPRRTQTR